MKMRCLLILATTLAMGYAAAANAGELSFGAKGGLITTNVTGIPEELEDVQSYRTSFSGGIFLNYAFDKALSIQSELLYVPKGFTGSISAGIVDVEVTPGVEFVEIPLLLKYTFLAGGNVRPYVFAGPSIGFVIDSELDIDVGWFSADIDISDFTNDTDYSLVAGAGIGYKTKYGLLTFDARFQRGFSDILESLEFDIGDEPQSLTFDEFKHYGFAFLAGIEF